MFVKHKLTTRLDEGTFEKPRIEEGQESFRRVQLTEWRANGPERLQSPAAS